VSFVGEQGAEVDNGAMIATCFFRLSGAFGTMRPGDDMTGRAILSLPRRLRGAAPLMLLVACTAAQAASYTMHRDPSCGCCTEWAKHVRQGLAAEVTVQDHADMVALKRELGVPEDLRSCHTMEVEGYVIEGHVPAADIARLLRERPAGVSGLAVPGMPVGSPGMEMGSRTQPYQVIAFGGSGYSVFASYK
jgi:hypothetical protein